MSLSASLPSLSLSPVASRSRGRNPSTTPRQLAASEVSPLPTRISRYRMSVDEVPVDFFADPDGSWEFSSLVEMAGFNPEHPGASVGALTQAFDGYPEGSAVITEVGVDCRYIAIAELPRAESAAARSTAVSSTAAQSGAFSGSSLTSSRSSGAHRAA